MTDRIEAASLGMAAIATQGKVFVEGAQHNHMITFLNKLREIGAGFNVRNNGIEFFYSGPLKGGILIRNRCPPGFMTDWQQPFVALLTQAEGHSISMKRFMKTVSVTQRPSKKWAPTSNILPIALAAFLAASSLKTTVIALL